MSRIGKLPIPLPEKVEFNISDDNVVTVKGPLGELHQAIDKKISVEVEDNQILIKRTGESKDEKSKHGLYRSLINNMVIGVLEGYKTVLELVGVGYKVNVNGNVIEFNIGYSHSIFLQIPEEVKAESVVERGKNPKLILTSYDKQLIGQVAAKIRSFRKPEPYKGKGIKFEGEVLRKKAGKTSAT
jgi:large subunit ribosomal protein L6